MAGRWHVILSRAALFLEKARLFPNTKFIVGLDTALRVLDKKYYSNSEKQAENGRITKHFSCIILIVLSEIKRLGCSFIVAGRLVEDSYKTFSSESSRLPLPQFHHLFEEMPFRIDVRFLYPCLLNSPDIVYSTQANW